MDRRTILKVGLGGAGNLLRSKLAMAGTKQGRFHLEIIASCLEDAMAAHAGGATRVEVAVHLEKGGFTPPLDLIRTIVDEVPIPARIMIREREGVVLSGSTELRSLLEKEKAIVQLPVNGFVLGFTKGGDIDVETLRELIAGPPSTHYTVHNAIEMTADPIASLKTLRAFPQVDRALVGGSTNFKPGAKEPLAKRIERLMAYKAVWEDSKRRLLVNGLSVEELKQVQREAGIREFHLSQQVRTPAKPFPVGKIDVNKVREVVALLSRP
jgi:copper homeostasis protein